ncbi:MAG: DUF4115 domain-containing protein [Thiotrichales bacterium]|nr:DUF4115 domain-containing protein [Thiotrichales bacterium]
MAEKKDPQLIEHLDRQGPGAYLRNAREEADMNLDAVANMLLLSPKTLELLEADAHDRLPAPTFVRGYLRGYARVLGLPSGPILDMYNRQGFEPPPLNNDATEPTQAHTSDIPVRLVTYAVAVALVLFVGLWWHSQQEEGFSIDGSLFDWLPDTSRDSSPLTAEESVTSPEEADANEPSIATTSDAIISDATTYDPAEELSQEELPQDDESNARPRAGETDPGPTDPGPAGTAVAMPSFEPVAPPGALESPFAPSFGGSPSGEGALSEAAPAGTEAEVATVTGGPPGADTAPGSGVSADTALPTTTDDTPSTEALPGGAPASVDGEALATQEAQPEAIAGIDRGADPGVEDGSVPIPEGVGAADSADEAADVSIADAAATETERAPPDAPAGSTVTAAGAVQSGLVLEFAHESWVEVYDRERVRLYFNLVQPGRVLSFDGPRPFDVLLGYSKDAQVTIDGQAFDIAPFTTHGVSRFSIGSESAGGATGADPDGTTMSVASESPAESSLVPDQ